MLKENFAKSMHYSQIKADLICVKIFSDVLPSDIQFNYLLGESESG